MLRQFVASTAGVNVGVARETWSLKTFLGCFSCDVSNIVEVHGLLD